jgi:hypothetical protein
MVNWGGLGKKQSSAILKQASYQEISLEELRKITQNLSQ